MGWCSIWFNSFRKKGKEGMGWREAVDKEDGNRESTGVVGRRRGKEGGEGGGDLSMSQTRSESNI